MNNRNVDWGLIIYHGIKNEEYVKSELKDIENIKYLNINEENIDSRKYNIILTGERFWKTIEEIGCEHALIFQMDAVLLKDDVDEYLEYDYIGAPWSYNKNNISNNLVGNGGFSLRNTKRMLEIIRNHPYGYVESGNENEDIYFSSYVINKPSTNIAKKFSVETIYYEDPTGMHKPNINNFPSKEHYIKILSKRIEK